MQVTCRPLDVLRVVFALFTELHFPKQHNKELQGRDNPTTLSIFLHRLRLVCLFTYSQNVTLSLLLGMEVLVLGKALPPLYSLPCKRNIWLKYQRMASTVTSCSHKETRLLCKCCVDSHPHDHTEQMQSNWFIRVLVVTSRKLRSFTEFWNVVFIGNKLQHHHNHLQAWEKEGFHMVVWSTEYTFKHP